MQVEVERDDAEFWFRDRKYCAMGTVIHNTEAEDVGIGSYEYHGHREFQKKIVQTSEFSEAEFQDMTIMDVQLDQEVTDPSDELVTAAEEALFDATYEIAQEKATEMSEE